VIATLETLHLRLTDFEGPLPLLLHLIEKNELEVTRVSVAAVADQFLALVASQGSSDLVTTGEFVAAAARLLLIKSRALLYRRDLEEAGSDEQDDAELLARQIAEYSQFQVVARFIGSRLESDESTHARPVPIGTAAPLLPPKVPVTALIRAAKRLLATPAIAAAEPDPWPNVIYSSLRQDLIVEMQRLRQTTFATLSRNAWHPLVVITMFLALLDAVRVAQLCMQQDEPFGTITISLPQPVALNA
jgi:segregation and condensation protein A